MGGTPTGQRFHLPQYHRKGNERTQTDEIAERIATSGELWGSVPRYGHTQPVVQAWRGPLPEGAWGVEFTTAVPPDPPPPPQRCEWRGPRPGVEVIMDAAGVAWAKIPVRVTKIVRREEA